jgi:uncharacterized protein
MEFEWDAAKAASNRRKHKVSFSEAATVFGDALSATVPDPDHSAEENRYIIVGMSSWGRLLIVAFVERPGSLIGARKLTLTERREYEETEK